MEDDQCECLVPSAKALTELVSLVDLIVRHAEYRPAFVDYLRDVIVAKEEEAGRDGLLKAAQATLALQSVVHVLAASRGRRIGRRRSYPSGHRDRSGGPVRRLHRPCSSPSLLSCGKLSLLI